MSNLAGISKALRRLGKNVKDPQTREALLAIEEKILELDARLTDTERRLKAGSL